MFGAEVAGGSTPIIITLGQGGTTVATSTGKAYSEISGAVTANSSGSVVLQIQAYKQQNGTGHADNVTLVPQS